MAAARMGPRNHVLDVGSRSPWEGVILMGKQKAARCKVQRRSALICAKTAELIEIPFGLWTRVAQGSMY